jgi:hypothetical protein
LTPNPNPVSKMQLGPLSQSQMNLADQCPRAWYYYRIHAPVIQGDMSYAEAGSVIHESIAEYYGIIADNPHDGEISGTFKQVLERNWTAKESLIKQLSGRRDKCITNFLNFEKVRMKGGGKYKPMFVEQNITGIINRIEYRAIVDAYWEDSGVAVDWKTGNKVILEMPDYIQGHMSTMILRSHGLTVNRFIFVSLLAGTVLELPKVDDRLIEEKALKMVDFWNKGTFPKTPGEGCTYCNWVLRCALEERGMCLWQL